MPRSLADKIADILDAHGHAWTTPDGKRPSTLEIRRTRAGRSDRETGAWSWLLYAPGVPIMDIGSQWPATEISRLGADGVDVSRNRFGQTSIDPSVASQKASHCPKCGGRGPLTLARSVANGGTMRNGSPRQAQSICAACTKSEGADATSSGSVG